MEKTKRQSNFELLRIFAIILIVLGHIQQHGSKPILIADNGYFAQPIIYLRLLVFEIGAIFGAIGNGLFIMISGYFMNANDRIDTGKIAKKMLLQLGFATIILMAAYSVCITFFANETFTWDSITIEIFNNSNWWFIGYYFLIIIIAKVFLNGFTAKLTQNQFRSLLLTALAVSQFGWIGDLLDGLTYGLRNLTVGIFYFLMGGYIARYNPFKNLRAYTFILAIAAAYGARFLSQYNIVSQSIDAFTKSTQDGLLNFHQSVQSGLSYQIAAVVIAICLFELFRRLAVSYNAEINFIGKSTLMIYMLHENNFFQCFYRNDSWMEALSSSVLAYCLKWFKWAAVAFAVGVTAFALYTLLGKLLPRMRPLFATRDSSE